MPRRNWLRCAAALALIAAAPACITPNSAVLSEDPALSMSCSEAIDVQSAEFMLVACEVKNDSARPTRLTLRSIELESPGVVASIAGEEEVRSMVARRRANRAGPALAGGVVFSAAGGGGSGGGAVAAIALAGITTALGAGLGAPEPAPEPERRLADPATAVPLPAHGAATTYVAVRTQAPAGVKAFRVCLQEPVSDCTRVPLNLDHVRLRQRR